MAIYKWLHKFSIHNFVESYLHEALHDNAWKWGQMIITSSGKLHWLQFYLPFGEWAVTFRKNAASCLKPALDKEDKLTSKLGKTFSNEWIRNNINSHCNKDTGTSTSLQLSVSSQFFGEWSKPCLKSDYSETPPNSTMFQSAFAFIFQNKFKYGSKVI